MTTPSPTVAAPQPWDEVRFREVLRTYKPFTPRVRGAIEHLVRCVRVYERAGTECAFDAAFTGAPDFSKLRVSIRRLAKARREALIAMGQHPDTSDLFPPVPTIPYDA